MVRFFAWLTKLCAWFGVPRRTVYYRPTKAVPKADPRFAEPIKAMMTQSSKTCDISGTRYVLSTVDGSEYYEIACQSGEGFMLQVKAEQLAKTIKCAEAAFVGGGCTLTDAREAETQQAGLYSSLAKKAGFDCDVAKYAAFAVQGND